MRLPKMSEEHSKLALGLVAGLAIALVGFLVYSMDVPSNLSGAFSAGAGISEEQASSVVKDTLSLTNPNSNIEVSSVTEENDLYKVTYKLDGQLQETYLTKNGKFLVQGLTNISAAQARYTDLNDFVGCLQQKGAVIFGMANNPDTQNLVQALGGPNLVSQIYYDCSSNQSRRVCLQNNITRVPSVMYQGQVLQQPQRVSQIEQLTGCKLGQ